MKWLARRLVLASVAGALILTLMAGTALAQNAINGLSIPGTDIDETLMGTIESDATSGFGGADLLFNDEGDDLTTGGEGDDALFGDEGNDALFGEGGMDNIDGGPAEDFLHAGTDDEVDIVEGGSGDDACVVGEEDTVSGCELVVFVEQQ